MTIKPANTSIPKALAGWLMAVVVSCLLYQTAIDLRDHPKTKTIQSKEDLKELSEDFDKNHDLLAAKRMWPELEQLCLARLYFHPDEPEVYSKLGLVYMNQNRYADAEAVFLQYSIIAPTASSLLYLAEAQQKLGKLLEEYVNLLLVLQLAPDNKVAQSLLRDLGAKPPTPTKPNNLGGFALVAILIAYQISTSSRLRS